MALRLSADTAWPPRYSSTRDNGLSHQKPQMGGGSFELSKETPIPVAPRPHVVKERRSLPGSCSGVRTHRTFRHRKRCRS